MAALSQAKTLGGVGSILIFIPFVSIIGYVLLAVAVKEVSDDLGDPSIFRNILIAVGTGIVGALAGAGVIFLGVMGSGFTFGASAIAGLLGGLFIVWVFLVISAVFLRRAYDTMGTKLNVGTFKTAATLYLIGAALTIVLVGFILLFVAEIVQAVAFFSIPDQPPSQGGAAPMGPSPAPSSSMPPAADSSKFCTSCGTKISPTATFCYKCGSKQP